MCRLIASPHTSLGVDMNGPLMQILESYRDLSDHHVQLQRKLEAQVQGHQSMALKLQQVQSRWNEERQDYKAEVKRLELLLAKVKRGLTEVTLARQDSLLRQRKRRDPPDDSGPSVNDGLQTIFEVLERARHSEDRAYNLQRATFRQRVVSPSAHMRRISQQLASKNSMTSLHAELPFGTPTEVVPSTLAEASLLESHASRDRKATRHAAADVEGFKPKTSESDDTFSTFSVEGDFIADEAAYRVRSDVDKEDAEDFVAVQRIVNILAHRQHKDAASIVPKLLGLFTAEFEDAVARTPVPVKRAVTHAPGSSNVAAGDRYLSVSTLKPGHGLAITRSPRSTSMPNALGITAPTVVTLQAGVHVQKHPTLMAKASGFLQKLRPQLHTETCAPHSASRPRFSFEDGDDTVPLSASPNSAFRLGVEGLRKSVSLSSIPAPATHHDSMGKPPLSPVAQSPLSSAPRVGSWRVSKIPTPISSSGSVVRFGRKREDSLSSLVTAIKHDDDVSRRSSPKSGSFGHSPTESRAESVTSKVRGVDRPNALAGTRFSSSNSLLDYTNTLRCKMCPSTATSSPVAGSEVESSTAAAKFPLSHTWLGKPTDCHSTAETAVSCSSGSRNSRNSNFVVEQMLH